MNTPRSCDELGVCQGRACGQCTAEQPAQATQGALPRYPFAPGVITTFAPARRWGRLGNVLLWIAVVALASVLAGVAAGFLYGKGIL